MDEKSLLHILSEFIAFRTVAGSNEEKQRCLQWIERRFLQHAGCTVLHGSVDGAPYLLLRHPNPMCLWFAHIDVVPGDEEQFVLQRKGAKAFGRGVKDMKGSSLPFLIAYEESCKKGRVPPVSILCTSDEETAGKTIPSLFEQAFLADVRCAFTPDAGSEPFLVTSLKGALWAELVCKGKSAHAAAPWEGVNPIDALAQTLAMFRQRFPLSSKDAWEMTVTPTLVESGEAKNQIPDTVRCVLDVRFPGELHATPDHALSFLQSLIPATCELREIKTADPLSVNPEHPMVQRIKSIAQSVLKQEVIVGKEHGSSDARHFGTHGIPAFLYGPVGGGLHAHDEWVSIPSLLQHCEISRMLLRELSEENIRD